MPDPVSPHWDRDFVSRYSSLKSRGQRPLRDTRQPLFIPKIQNHQSLPPEAKSSSSYSIHHQLRITDDHSRIVPTIKTGRAEAPPSALITFSRRRLNLPLPLPQGLLRFTISPCHHSADSRDDRGGIVPTGNRPRSFLPLWTTFKIAACRVGVKSNALCPSRSKSRKSGNSSRKPGSSRN